MILRSVQLTTMETGKALHLNVKLVNKTMLVLKMENVDVMFNHANKDTNV